MGIATTLLNFNQSMQRSDIKYINNNQQTTIEIEKNDILTVLRENWKRRAHANKLLGQASAGDFPARCMRAMLRYFAATLHRIPSRLMANRLTMQSARFLGCIKEYRMVFVLAPYAVWCSNISNWNRSY